MEGISIYLNEDQQKFVLDLDKRFEMNSDQRTHHRALIGKIIKAHHVDPEDSDLIFKPV